MKPSSSINFSNNLKRFKLVILFLVVLVTVSSCNKDTEQSAMTFLHVSGHDMIDENGNKVLLRSIGLGNWLLPEGYMWKFGKDGDRPRKIEKVVSYLIGEDKANVFWKEFRANYITEADIIRIKELGFNAVRPALNARLFLTEDDVPVFVDEGFMHLDNLIQWCKKHQLYVIIDMHGAPGGQTGANIDDSPNDLPELFMESKHQDALVKLWIEIAKKYKDEPIVAAYDLLNEPLPEITGAAEKYGHLVEPLYKRLTKEIREIDKKHMITLEGVNWANNWEIFGEPFDDNTFYQFHYYCWDKPDLLKDISYYLKKREKLNTPIWVGETGEKANTIYWGTTQYFEKNNIGWSFWPWKKMDTKNTPYSIKKPTNWDAIVEYSKGGEKPNKEIAEQAFNELIENIKLSNCEYFEDVTNAIFRRVPVKIEAENYLQGNYNETWFVADTTKKSSYYRPNEFVPIDIIKQDTALYKSRQTSEQCIVLKAGEWTSYSVNSSKKGLIEGSIKMVAHDKNASLELILSNSSKIVSIDTTSWKVYHVDNIQMNAGENKIIIRALESTVKIDWVQCLE